MSVWVGLTTFRIERLNAQADYYLPRTDEDGKWRISQKATPHDQLRGLVGGIGLFQYLLAPLLIAFSALYFSRHKPASHRILAVCAASIGLVAVGLAFHRGYFTSLGW
ncbi:MAG: hypothetical protein MUF13_12845, partial [Akkermansiaceae bacterium]|jgi:hypothetical protein|nr:hypothetical protein [Akkermansiaceae bacterium]